MCSYGHMQAAIVSSQTLEEVARLEQVIVLFLYIMLIIYVELVLSFHFLSNSKHVLYLIFAPLFLIPPLWAGP